MNTEWMGRYRPLVAALVVHVNTVARSIPDKREIGEGIELNTIEWQILEYIIEHCEDIISMITMSSDLGIPQSSFSKTVKALCEKGLVEKYQMSNNRKNIILRPSEHAVLLYDAYVMRVVRSNFQGFFDTLDTISDEDLDTFVKALLKLNEDTAAITDANRPKLIRKL